MDALEYVTMSCPYCGETLELTIERSLSGQSYSEDCHLCCRPMLVAVRTGESSNLEISIKREDE